MCCDSDAARRRNKPGYMRGTPWILRYMRATRVRKNAQVRTIRREGRSQDRNPQRLHAGLLAMCQDDDTVHASWRHEGQREQGICRGTCRWITS